FGRSVMLSERLTIAGGFTRTLALVAEVVKLVMGSSPNTEPRAPNPKITSRCQVMSSLALYIAANDRTRFGAALKSAEKLAVLRESVRGVCAKRISVGTAGRGSAAVAL